MKTSSKSETPRRPPSKRIAAQKEGDGSEEKLTFKLDQSHGIIKIRKVNDENEFKIKLKLPVDPPVESEENRRRSHRARKIADYTQLSAEDVLPPKPIIIEKKEPVMNTPVKEKAPPKPQEPKIRKEEVKKAILKPKATESAKKKEPVFRIKIPKKVVEDIKVSDDLKIQTHLISDTTTSSPGPSKEDIIDIQPILERKIYNITFGSEFKTPECIEAFYDRIKSKYGEDVKNAFYSSYDSSKPMKNDTSEHFPKLPIRDEIIENTSTTADFRYDLEIITNTNQKEKIKVSFQPGKVNPFTEVPNPYDKVLREQFFNQFNFTMDYRSGYAPINIQAQQEKEMNYKQHFIKKKQSCANTRLKRVCGVSYVKQNESQQLNVNHVFQKLPPLVFQGSNGCLKLDEYENMMKQIFKNMFEDCSKIPLMVTCLEAEDELLMREYLNFPERRLRLAKGRVWIITSFNSIWKFVRDRMFICIHFIYDPVFLLKKSTASDFSQEELARLLAESNIQLGLLCRKSTSGKKSFVKTFFEDEFTDDEEDDENKPKVEGESDQKNTIVKKRGRKLGYKKLKDRTEEKAKRVKESGSKVEGLKKRHLRYFDKARDLVANKQTFPVEAMEDFKTNFSKIMEPYIKLLFFKEKKEETASKSQEEPVKQPTVDEVIFENSLLPHMGEETINESQQDSNIVISKSHIQHENEAESSNDSVIRKLEFDVDISELSLGILSQTNTLNQSSLLTTNNQSLLEDSNTRGFDKTFSMDNINFSHIANKDESNILGSPNNNELSSQSSKKDFIINESSHKIENVCIEASNNEIKVEDKIVEEKANEPSSGENNFKIEDLKKESGESSDIKHEDQVDPQTKIEAEANEDKEDKEDKLNLPESLAELRKELKSDPKGNILTMSMRVELHVHEDSWKTADRHTQNILYTLSEYINLAILENFRIWTDNRLDIYRNTDTDSLLDTDEFIQLVETGMFYNEKLYKSPELHEAKNKNWKFDHKINNIPIDENNETQEIAPMPPKSKKVTLESLQDIRDKDINTFSLPIYLITTRDSFAFDLIEKVTIVDMLGRKVKKTEFFFDPLSCPSNFKGFIDKFPDYRVGVTTYNDFYTHEELSLIERNCYETERKFFSNHFLPMTGQMTCTSEKVRRTKFFFGARYIWTRQQLSDAHSMVGAGIRVDVSSAPKWIKELVEKPMVDTGIIEKDFINSIAMNVYHDGKEGLAQHFDDAVRFKQPIFTLRIFSDSRLSFGSQFYGFCNGAFSIPMPRGCITVLEEESYSANGIKHCVRPCDMTGKSSAIILRQMHHKVFNEAKIYDEFVDFPAWFSTLSVHENAVPYFEQKRIEAEDILKGNTVKKDY